jgi:superfamily II DNA or RNA helicase
MSSPIDLKIGDKVRIGERIGEVIKLDERSASTIVKVAFEEGPVKDYVSPPTKIEKILAPLEQLQNNRLDSPLNFDLHYEAIRLSLAYAYDHLLSLSFTRTNLEPYQVEAVYKTLNTYKHRVLIADDVGLGKTIETGMILKELALRGFAQRILIIVPAPLRFQWQRELRDRFDESFIIYDSAYVETLRNFLPKDANVWEANARVITSLDFVKKEEVLNELERTTWDVIIFDEAHKLSATKYGDKIERSLRFRVAQALYDKTNSLILLTATPHKGDPFAFYSLLTLLDPYIFENENSIISARLNEIMIRRGKDGIVDSEGKPVFRPREVVTIPISYNEKEKTLYDVVTAYVQEFYNLAKAQNNRAVGFAMVLLQKRMVSSIAAIRSSLKNRLANLVKGAVTLSKEEEARLRDYFDDPDSLDDWERERFERHLEALALPTTPEGLKKEIDILKALVKFSEEITRDSKGEALIKFIQGILQKEPKEKILIFTEYRDTLDYIVGILREQGYHPLVIHGGMEMGARREAEEHFRSPAFNILVATDAAGEGINLQFCHIMINYDLPWNPNRIDQRIGRLHRYGQKRDVKVHNLFVTDTREGQILARLMQKVAIIEKDLGGKISEIVGFVLEGVNLQELIMKALAENVPVEVTAQDIERSIEERKRAYDTIEKAFLIDLRKFDLEETLRVIKKSQERSTNEAEIERFIRFSFHLLGGKVEPTRKRMVYRLIPPKKILNERLKERYDMVTFSKEIAKELGDEVEFMVFGHPLLEAIIEYCRDKNYRFGGRATVRYSDQFSQPGVIFNFLLGFDDATGGSVNEELFPMFLGIEGDEVLLNPREIATFNSATQTPSAPDIEEIRAKIPDLYTKAHDLALKKAREICAIVQDRRSQKIAIKREDTRKFFSTKFKEEEERLKEFRLRLSQGEDMTIAIRGSEKRLEDLRSDLQKTLERLEEEELIIERNPELISAAIIIPRTE